ncbi:hypothetical protein SO802_012438 [Lithocarpus litseifolius]|uniref:Gag-pol polyprotein n=1 Tax=Lithocarpus litseifolius TaxID=425828 RepID=A0AAW2D4X0_9ROSI
MPMAELYAYLLEKKLVTLIFTKPKDGPPLPGFDPSKKCKHHFGPEGHTLEECRHLRHGIQDLHRQQIPPGMRTPAPLTSVVIEEIIELPVDSGVPALKKEQTLPAIEGFAPLILSLLGIAEPSLGFVQKETLIVPAIRGFDPLVLSKPIQGISKAFGPKALEVALPSPVIISLKMFSLAPNL